MRLRLTTYLLLSGLLLLPLGLCAQTPMDEGSQLDETTRLEVQGRLNQFVDGMQRIANSCKAKLSLSEDEPVTDDYIKMQEYRLNALERNLKSMELRWDNYYPLQQWEISQDEELMASVEKFQLLKQAASDSLTVRKQMIQSLQDFSDAYDYMAGLDSTYNRIGKQAMKLSLTSKTAPLLEKQKKKEQLLFATVQEKFEKAKVAQQLHMVSSARMNELEDCYASLKSKSDAIQAMKYQPILLRIKDYLMSFAAIAVLLMFLNMARSKMKAAKQLRENIKKYSDKLNWNNGKDDYPTI